ncbi:helix-turn-helix domain-containing protein [Clostridium sp. 19966]|uniref:helix-turn-helix transcriptional regulator n=1 Tax=Clostridium sp. 19966 TaxID=2768166 RepID=UPI0028DF70EF|nr:helix-turn-helix domain-containing protein [Clostridium sp. 19966]MDT8717266.1 helix-turn-helix domain-containing protein [Clostridium sp. 19966]
MKAINNNFILAQKGVLSYEKLKDVEFNYDSINKELLENLLEAVEKNNVDKIYSDIEKIEIEIVKESTAPEVAKSNIISFEFEVLNNIINMKGDPSIISNSIERLQNDFTFVKDLKNRLQEFCIETAKYITDLKQYKSKGVLLEVKDYIENNFQKDLRLKSLSEHFYINPIYLGQIFKKNFGMSFNDYLNNIRVEKAKELLLNTDKKICDIAENVGYKDTNYFISRFEKITHTTPTEYKKICKKDI